MLTKESDGVLPLPDDITNKVCVINPTCLADGYKQPKYQLFFAESGFGCHKENKGTAVFGVFLADKERTRFERYEFIGIANSRLIIQLCGDPRKK
jgi:hypothetical protein